MSSVSSSVVSSMSLPTSLSSSTSVSITTVSNSSCSSSPNLSFVSTASPPPSSIGLEQASPDTTEEEGKSSINILDSRTASSSTDVLSSPPNPLQPPPYYYSAPPIDPTFSLSAPSAPVYYSQGGVPATTFAFPHQQTPSYSPASLVYYDYTTGLYFDSYMNCFPSPLLMQQPQTYHAYDSTPPNLINPNNQPPSILTPPFPVCYPAPNNDACYSNNNTNWIYDSSNLWYPNYLQHQLQNQSSIQTTTGKSSEVMDVRTMMDLILSERNNGSSSCSPLSSNSVIHQLCELERKKLGGSTTTTVPVAGDGNLGNAYTSTTMFGGNNLANSFHQNRNGRDSGAPSLEASPLASNCSFFDIDKKNVWVQNLAQKDKRVFQKINGQRILGPPSDYKGGEPESGCEVFVGHLPQDLMEMELFPLFSEIGFIYELRMMMNFSGMNRGYCFIRYTTPSDARKCIRRLDGFQIRDGVFLGVVASVDNRKLWVGGIQSHQTKEDIKSVFQELSDGVVDVIMYPSHHDLNKPRNYVFIEYESHKAAARARRSLVLKAKDIRICGCPIEKIEWAEPECQVDRETMQEVKILFIRNLTPLISEDSIRHFFKYLLYQRYEDLTLINSLIVRVRKIKDYAFVHFATREVAEAALNMATQDPLIENHPVEITWSRPVADKREHLLRKTFNRSAMQTADLLNSAGITPNSGGSNNGFNFLNTNVASQVMPSSSVYGDFNRIQNPSLGIRNPSFFNNNGTQNLSLFNNIETQNLSVFNNIETQNPSVFNNGTHSPSFHHNNGTPNPSIFNANGNQNPSIFNANGSQNPSASGLSQQFPHQSLQSSSSNSGNHEGAPGTMPSRRMMEKMMMFS